MSTGEIIVLMSWEKTVIFKLDLTTASQDAAPIWHGCQDKGVVDRLAICPAENSTIPLLNGNDIQQTCNDLLLDS